MSLLQKLREGVEKATGEVGELAQSAKSKLEFARLNNDRNQLLHELGEQIYARHRQGRPIPEVEEICERLVAVDAEIRRREAQAIHSKVAPPDEEAV